MKRSTVRFGQLRQLLESMDFCAEKGAMGWRFEHAPSGTVFLFRPYRSADLVYMHDLFLVRSQLDWRGLMAADAFDSSLTKTPA